MKALIKPIKYVSAFGISIALFAGALQSESPQIVGTASLIGLFCLIAYIFVNTLHDMELYKLDLNDGSDISKLRQIRDKVKGGEPVAEDLIQLSEIFSEKADSAYKEHHGRDRQLTFGVYSAEDIKKLSGIEI